MIVLSGESAPEVVLDCLDHGVVSYLAKCEGREHFLAAITAAVQDRPYETPTMGKAMYLGRGGVKPALSPRELEVLRAWFRADSKDLVAERLGMSPSTVETHIARIRTKYAAVGRAAKTKAALVARAIRDGLVTADEL